MINVEERNLDALKNCNVCLVILTENFIKDESVWIQPIEADRMKMVLAALIKEGLEIPGRLKKLNWWKKYYFKDENKLEAVTTQIVKDLIEKGDIDE